MEDKDALVTSLATQFLEHLQRSEPEFERAFYRFEAEPGSYGGKASVESAGGVSLVSSVQNTETLQGLGRTGHELLGSLGKDRGLFLLTVTANYDYDIQFEWDDLDRWNISKLNGGTGIPEGL